MHFVIQCGGLPFNGETIETQSLGGSESAAYYLSKELVKLGHSVHLFTNSQKQGLFDGVNYVWNGPQTEVAPLGENFDFYASNTPCDVLIIQRFPGAFNKRYASKLNYLWLHDMPSKAHKGVIINSLFNMNGILVVSEFHKKLVMEKWALKDEFIKVLRNGVDLELYKDNKYLKQNSKFEMFYSSRPERGLENLVKPDGIMERLGPDYHLNVCGYENTVPMMKDYYEYLWGRCSELSNVSNRGPLSKNDLSKLQLDCDAWVYPTPGPISKEFREVSCISAMEAVASDSIIIASNTGAIPETLEGYHSFLIDNDENDNVNIDEFVNKIKAAKNKGHLVFDNKDKLSWTKSAESLVNIINQRFSLIKPSTILHNFIKLSDIYAALYLIDNYCLPDNQFVRQMKAEIDYCYNFAFNNDFKNHYDSVYRYEKDRGIDYGPENLDGNLRFEAVSQTISNLPKDSRVMDYGCAHGHYTINLAKRFPDLEFIGVDINESNIEKARKWAKDENVNNVIFVNGYIENGHINNFENYETKGFRAIIAAEVLEHVANPQEYADSLRNYLSEDGIMIITTPYGPWEHIGYKEHHPFRAHLHHFERDDLREMWGHMTDFSLTCASSGYSKFGDPLGSFITTFRKSPGEKSQGINYDRKIKSCHVNQTISFCMIIKDAEDSLLKTLKSIESIADEIILCIDPATKDRTELIISNFMNDIKLWPIVKVYQLPEPAIISGFDEARNFSLTKANCDWIVWIDSDEVINYPEKLRFFAKDNLVNGYSLYQHHVSAEPLGVLKSDMPCRMFRNGKGIRFFGVVHEHPEVGLNEGVGNVQLLNDAQIIHNGYFNETVRKGRFDRNINLIARDREKYPARKIGKMLWMRDLSLMIKYSVEQGVPKESLETYALQGIQMFEELLEEGELRMLVDGMEWYGICSATLGAKLLAEIRMDIKPPNMKLNVESNKIIRAYFYKQEHMIKLIDKIATERLQDYEAD